MTSLRAFTLIELLVVVGIIAILAAIAVPNFLEAQVRSKVSRAQADMRTLRTALEAYAVDKSTYPVNGSGVGFTGDLIELTRPTQYITTLPTDPFTANASYYYIAAASVSTLQDERFGRYVLASNGPDRDLDTGIASTRVYDPTNGSVSDGDVVATHRTADPQAIARNGAGGS